jgi:hypothetical protein
LLVVADHDYPRGQPQQEQLLHADLAGFINDDDII